MLTKEQCIDKRSIYYKMKQLFCNNYQKKQSCYNFSICAAESSTGARLQMNRKFPKLIVYKDS